MEELNVAERSGCSSDRGETYVEILVTLVIVGLAGIAIIGALMTSISASTVHRNIANVDYALKSAVEQASYDIEYSPTPLFQDCGPQTATSLLAMWNTEMSGHWPAIPAYDYSAWISKVECFTETSSTSSLDSACTSTQSSPSTSPTPVPAGTCSSDDSGIVQITVSVQDSSNVVTSQSTLVRNPIYGTYSPSSL